MDLFLTHSLALLWTSTLAARQLTARTCDRILAAALLGWGNLVVSSLLLSLGHRLGDPRWFFGTSLVLGASACLLLVKLPPEPASARAEPLEPGPHRRLVIAFAATIVPLALANIAVAYSYLPSNPEALAWQLPRMLYYLGQNSLAHFDATDPRQTLLPFNHGLLQLPGLIYGPPLSCLNVFNLAAWALSGIGVYRLCRLTGCSANASLVACWLAMTALPVVAQAAATTAGLILGVGLLCALVFGLRHQQTQRTRDAMLVGLAVGLTAGSDLRALFLCTVAGLLCLAWSFRRQHAHSSPRPAASRLRRWIVPVLLASVLSLPFALINLTGSKPLPGGSPAPASADAMQSAWTGFLPLLSKPAPLLPLNEDLAGFGFTGLLFMAAGFSCLLRPREPIGRLAGLAFGWIAADLLLHHWSLSFPRDLAPALFLLGPCAARAIASVGAGRPVQRQSGGLALLVVLLAGGWSAGVYLLRNTSRPLLPLLNTAFIPPGLPSLPLLVEHHLSRQSRINIDTDGTDECIFPFMVQGRHQRITSCREIKPEAYNLISRSTFSRNAAYLDPSGSPAYSLIPLPAKPTAGVEFLGTVGRGPAARDYFGIEPHAGRTKPVATNRNLLVTLYHGTDPAGKPAGVRLRLAGLNPEDHARLAVEQRTADGSTVPLATFDAQGEAPALIATSFALLVFRAFDSATGAEMGSTAISYRPTPKEDQKNLDPTLPTNSRSIFVTDLVLSKDSQAVSVDGLLPVEGPFPQWDLPYLRWQRQSSAVITIPPIEPLRHLQLSFSVRLNVRRKAALDVLFNGQAIKRYRFEDHLAWYDETLELTPQPGANVLEFRDAPLNSEPDWLDYLERYPDVKKHALDHGIPPEQGAREHYETHGRAEGRTLQTILHPEPAPDGYYFMYRNIRLEGFKTP